MKAIDKLFSDVFLPQKALVVYRNLDKGDNDIYVEAFDINQSGILMNAHPLAVEESTALSLALDSSDVLKKDFLTSKDLLSENVLHINVHRGCVLWHTPPQEASLLFKKDLSIPCGKAHIPAMVWQANKETLYVYAVKGKPKISSTLYHAPFFNVYHDGGVCMGTVEIDMESVGCLEEFISKWESYFFNSYFSHVIADSIAVKGNIVQLWQQQVGSGRPFPEDVLIKSNMTIKDLLP